MVAASDMASALVGQEEMKKPLLFGLMHLCAGGGKAATIDPARRKMAEFVKRRIVIFWWKRETRNGATMVNPESSPVILQVLREKRFGTYLFSYSLKIEVYVLLCIFLGSANQNNISYGMVLSWSFE